MARLSNKFKFNLANIMPGVFTFVVMMFVWLRNDPLNNPAGLPIAISTAFLVGWCGYIYATRNQSSHFCLNFGLSIGVIYCCGMDALNLSHNPMPLYNAGLIFFQATSLICFIAWHWYQYDEDDGFVELFMYTIIGGIGLVLCLGHLDFLFGNYACPRVASGIAAGLNLLVLASYLSNWIRSRKESQNFRPSLKSH